MQRTPNSWPLEESYEEAREGMSHLAQSEAFEKLIDVNLDNQHVALKIPYFLIPNGSFPAGSYDMLGQPSTVVIENLDMSLIQSGDPNIITGLKQWYVAGNFSLGNNDFELLTDSNTTTLKVTTFGGEIIQRNKSAHSLELFTGILNGIVASENGELTTTSRGSVIEPTFKIYDKLFERLGNLAGSYVSTKIAYLSILKIDRAMKLELIHTETPNDSDVDVNLKMLWALYNDLTSEMTHSHTESLPRKTNASEAENLEEFEQDRPNQPFNTGYYKVATASPDQIEWDFAYSTLEVKKIVTEEFDPSGYDELVQSIWISLRGHMANYKDLDEVIFWDDVAEDIELQ